MNTLINSICPFCGEGYLHRENRDVEYKYKNGTLLITQPGIYCDHCSESILEPSDLKATRRDLQEFKARIDGRLTPREIKKLRKAIGWTQKQAGAILGGGHNAFSRYENGELEPPKSVNLVLSLLSKNKELIKDIS